MKVVFKKQLKVRDVIERYEKDMDVARAISRNIEEWDLTDSDTGEAIPLPEPDTPDWYLEILWSEWIELVDLWSDHRRGILDLPSPKGERS